MQKGVCSCDLRYPLGTWAQGLKILTMQNGLFVEVPEESQEALLFTQVFEGSLFLGKARHVGRHSSWLGLMVFDIVQVAPSVVPICTQGSTLDGGSGKGGEATLEIKLILSRLFAKYSRVTTAISEQIWLKR